ncbi:MAG: hypothetical protein ACK5IQ_01570, partial [Bacteroidales bacterium]
MKKHAPSAMDVPNLFVSSKVEGERVMKEKKLTDIAYSLRMQKDFNNSVSNQIDSLQNNIQILEQNIQELTKALANSKQAEHKHSIMLVVLILLLNV